VLARILGAHAEEFKPCLLSPDNPYSRSPVRFRFLATIRLKGKESLVATYAQLQLGLANILANRRGTPLKACFAHQPMIDRVAV